MFRDDGCLSKNVPSNGLLGKPSDNSFRPSVTVTVTVTVSVEVCSARNNVS